jgi:hypothetical protein
MARRKADSGDVVKDIANGGDDCFGFVRGQMDPHLSQGTISVVKLHALERNQPRLRQCSGIHAERLRRHPTMVQRVTLAA